MTPAAFQQWLADMRAAGLIRYDIDAAKKLDISANAVVTMKGRGADTRTALACQALLNELEPYA